MTSDRRTVEPKEADVQLSDPEFRGIAHEAFYSLSVVVSCITIDPAHTNTGIVSEALLNNYLHISNQQVTFSPARTIFTAIKDE